MFRELGLAGRASASRLTFSPFLARFKVYIMVGPLFLLDWLALFICHFFDAFIRPCPLFAWRFYLNFIYCPRALAGLSIFKH